MSAVIRIRELEHLTSQGKIDGVRLLIQCLAVQGKLGTQDSTDESASELLRRVKIKAGSDVYGPPTNAVPSVQLPRRWCWCRLCDLGEFCGGATPSMARREYWNGTIPWVSPKDMKSDRIKNTELAISHTALEESRIRLIPRNSVLIVARSGILRRTLPVAVNDVQCTVNQDLKVLTLHLPEMADYLRLMLKGHEGLILRELVKTGTTVQSLRYAEFEQRWFPIPPEPEQARILAKVKYLLGLCDELESQQVRQREVRIHLNDAILDRLVAAADPAEFAAAWQRVRGNFDLLYDVPENVDTLRRAILQLAVQGRLVGSYEPAPVLPMEQLARRANMKNGLSVRQSGDSPIRCLPISAMRNGVIDCSTGKPVPLTKEKAEPYLVGKGDVFIVRGNGSKDLVGRAGLVEEAADGVIFPDLFIRVPLDLSKIHPHYFLIAWNSSLVRRQIESLARTTSGIWKVNQGHIASIGLPVPSMQVQKEIVTKTKTLMALCDDLEAKLKQQRDHADQLAQAIVNAVMNGKMLDGKQVGL
jgi:type I restriction enzyme S subunit